MKKPVETQRIKAFEVMRAPLDLQAAIKESNRCLLCFDAPCSAGCPAGTDPGTFIRQIRFYNYKGAARTIRDNNILGGICAHICPVDQLCEKECSVKALEDPINIGGLQQFAHEYGISHHLEPMRASNKSRGNIAIIGGGPAGLGCASALLKKDFRVTIFERENQAGGVPLYNIPEYRLPAEVINEDIDNLKALGAEFNFNMAVTDKNATEKLLSEGFDAVFISTGLSTPMTLETLEGFANATDYNSFLRKYKFGEHKAALQNKIVAVIGGGSVAIDSAVTAKACGAKKVYLLSLEQLGELPAEDEEIHLAQLMDIIFKAGTQLTSVKENNKIITGLSGVEIEWKQAGLYAPSNAVAIDGTQFSINVDLVVQAIGTKPGLEITHIGNTLKTNGKGVIQVSDTFETSMPFVFAAGDVVNGGKTVVQAVGEGKKAAECIINALNGRTKK